MRDTLHRVEDQPRNDAGIVVEREVSAAANRDQLKRKSSLFIGVGEDAAIVARKIAARRVPAAD